MPLAYDEVHVKLTYHLQHPDDYEPIVTFFAFGVLILGGLASYRGVVVGAILLALLGADLEVTARDAFTDEQRDLLAGFDAEASREISFPSMVLFVEQDSTRLVQIRALEGAFPFYGELETEPANAVNELRTGTAGTYRIGIIPTLAPYLLPLFLTRFAGGPRAETAK